MSLRRLVASFLTVLSLTAVSLSAQSTTQGTWVAQGPSPTLNGQDENVPGPNPVAGAVHTIVADPANANTLYVGAVNGGVWRTTNATAATPTWTPLTDQFPSLSISALELDPTDASNQTLVAGTGVRSSFGAGGAAIGLLRTTNGGNTWTQLGQVALAGRNISGVGPRGNTILVSVSSGTSPGIYRSTDGGATFPFISGINGLNAGAVFDLVGDPGNVNRFYAGVGGATGGIFRTDNAGASWTNVTDGIAVIGATTGNIELAVHNNAGAATNAVYVAIVNNGRLAGILRSANQGAVWTAMDLPQTNDGGTINGIHPGGQGNIHLSIVASPTNAFVVYIGGDRQPSPFPNSIGAVNFSGRLFRGNASVAPTGGVPSPQWTPLTHNGTAGNSSPHADSREIVFDANGNIVEGDDGGIYRRTSPGDATGNWFSVIGNLQVAEFHDIAYDNTSNIIIGGAQDTGTPEQTATGSTTWRSVTQADGGDVAVDNITLFGGGQSIRYASTQNLGGFQRRTIDAANNQVGATVFPPLTVIGGGAALVRQFVTPVELNAIDPTRLIIAGINSIYESLNQGNTISEIGPGQGTPNQNAIAYGGRRLGVNNLDVLYVGRGGTVLLRTVAGGALNATTALPAGAGTVNDIVMNPNDWQTAYVVTSSNQVFQTTNAGATWTNLTGDIGQGGAVNFRTVQYVVRPANPGRDLLVVGTNAGVRVSVQGNFGFWFRLASGFPNAPCWDLDYDATDNILVAGTLGRGAWALANVSTLNVPPVARCQNVTVSAGPTCTANASINNGSFDPDGGPVTLVQSPPGPYSLGTTPVTLTVTDILGAAAMCTATVTVVDTTKPVVSSSVAQTILWPPNHSLVNVGLTVSATDNCSANPTIQVRVFSNEDDEGETGDGNSSPDAKDIAPNTLRLRQERSGNGRVYLNVVTATDAAGNLGVSCSTVVVPQSQSNAAINAVDAAAAAARTFCAANNGAPPPGYVVVGDGPVIGPKQ